MPTFLEPPKSVKGSHEVFVGDDGDNPEGMEEDNLKTPNNGMTPKTPEMFGMKGRRKTGNGS